jgi:hypothetical protein
MNPDDVERVRSVFQTAFDPAEARRSTIEFRLPRGARKFAVWRLWGSLTSRRARGCWRRCHRCGCQKAGIEARHRLFERRKVSCACLARRLCGLCIVGMPRHRAWTVVSGRVSRIVAQADFERSLSFASASDVPVSCIAVGPKSTGKPLAR